MKLKITAMVLVAGMVSSLSFGVADTLVTEGSSPSKAPVKILDVENELATIASSGSDGEGYAADRESDEGEEGVSRGMRSSHDSTPLPSHERKKSSRVRSFSKERLKNKFNEVVGTLRGRKLSGESVPESEEEDSAYEPSIGSRSPNRSLTPARDEAEETLKTLSQLQASGLSAEEQLLALKASLAKKVKAQSAPPSTLRMHRESERRPTINRARNPKLWNSEIVRPIKGNVSE